MGNLGGMEILVVFLVALIVLGPTKLPSAARQVGRAVNELRRLSGSFQQELRDALEEPMAETRAMIDGEVAQTRAMIDGEVAQTRATIDRGMAETRTADQAADAGTPADGGADPAAGDPPTD